MSNATSPVTTMFDMQRNLVLQSQKAFQQSLDTQKQASETFLKAMETSIDAATQANTLNETAVDAYFDALEATVPGSAEGVEELRASVYEQIEAGEEIQAETWGAVQEYTSQNVDAMDEFADNFAAIVDESFETFLEAHQQLEDQTVSAAEAVEVPIDE